MMMSTIIILLAHFRKKMYRYDWRALWIIDCRLFGQCKSGQANPCGSCQDVQMKRPMYEWMNEWMVS